jgi:hypothetical protein
MIFAKKVMYNIMFIETSSLLLLLLLFLVCGCCGCCRHLYCGFHRLLLFPHDFAFCDFFLICDLNVYRSVVAGYQTFRLCGCFFVAVEQSKDRSFDLGMYTTLSILAFVTSCAYALQYREYKAAIQRGARRWSLDGKFLALMIAGFVTMTLKSALFCAWAWKRKNPDLLSAPKLSYLASSLQADLYTTYGCLTGL